MPSHIVVTSLLTDESARDICGKTTLNKKRKEIFLKFKDIQMGSVAKSYTRKGFLIYEEMRKYLSICEETKKYKQR
jgi:hypothetical protein